VTRSITIENTGKVLAKYKFIPKLDEKVVCKPWLYINPPVALIIPGEKAKVEFTVLVDKKTALDFNLGKEKLEDILILHLDGGIDYFVSSFHFILIHSPFLNAIHSDYYKRKISNQLFWFITYKPSEIHWTNQRV
jgi:hypothetical protein